MWDSDPASRGCHMHLGQRVFRCGNPTKDTDYKDIQDALKNGAYKESGCDSLRPKDLRMLRVFLLAGSSIPLLGAYIIIMIASRLFLRSDEILTLKVEDFFPSLFNRVAHNNSIEALALRIWGKTDHEYKYYWLWVDDEFPELCPVRHLLIFIYLSGIKAGPVFPAWREMTTAARTKSSGTVETNDDGVFCESISYGTFSKWFKRVLTEVLPNRGEYLKVGLHMFRKTGYRLAIWGGGLWPAIKADARHVKDEDALNYAGDS